MMLCIILLLSALIAPSHASTGCDATAIPIPLQDTRILDDVEDSCAMCKTRLPGWKKS